MHPGRFFRFTFLVFQNGQWCFDMGKKACLKRLTQFNIGHMFTIFLCGTFPSVLSQRNLSQFGDIFLVLVSKRASLLLPWFLSMGKLTKTIIKTTTITATVKIGSPPREGLRQPCTTIFGTQFSTDSFPEILPFCYLLGACVPTEGII